MAQIAPELKKMEEGMVVDSELAEQEGQVEFKVAPESPFVSDESIVGAATPEIDVNNLPQPETVAEIPISEAVELRKSEKLIKIEGMLSEGLDEFYDNLTGEEQLSFKTSGEALAMEINEAVEDTKNRKIIHTIVEDLESLIYRWLQKLQKRNELGDDFLKQEAKDRMQKIYNEYFVETLG